MTHFKSLLTAIVLMVLSSYSLSTAASERGTSQQARSLLENAVATLQTQGSQKAFASFNDSQGRFVQNDLYIFVIDMNGTYKASGANPKLVGQSLADTEDAAGKPVGQEILTLADKIGYGIVEYEWLNRKTNDVEHKFSRIKRVGDYVLGVGFYLPEDNS